MCVGVCVFVCGLNRFYPTPRSRIELAHFETTPHGNLYWDNLLPLVGEEGRGGGGKNTANWG